MSLKTTPGHSADTSASRVLSRATAACFASLELRSVRKTKCGVSTRRQGPLDEHPTAARAMTIRQVLTPPILDDHLRRGGTGSHRFRLTSRAARGRPPARRDAANVGYAAQNPS